MKTHSFFARLAKTLSLILLITLAGPTNAATNVCKKNGPEPDLAYFYDELAHNLAKGGHNILVLPAQLEGTNQYDKPNWWKDCALSKQLSVPGRKDAYAIGRALYRLGIPIKMVRSGELCSSLNMASAIHKSQILVTQDLNPVEVQLAQGRDMRTIAVQARSYIEEQPDADGNTLTIFPPIPPGLTPYEILSRAKESDTVIFKRVNEGPIELVAHLTVAQWKEMANYIEYRNQCAVHKPIR
jgi:hypothetical protein